MAARIEPLVTVDDLEALPEDGNRYEVIEGEIFVSRAPGVPHQVLSGNIYYSFRKYLEEQQIGIILATPGLIFDQYNGVIPDLVFFTHRTGETIIANNRLTAAPEIVIEILSSGAQNVDRDRVAKRQLYSKNGVKEYWIVDGENRAIEIYRQSPTGLEPDTVLTRGERITSPLLPNFDCPLDIIFEE
ncbi:MAG TPA: Uma2 family endonuclease [Pyrinomonadaceae bacterium]|nr:Uma2 family endonuclease [Pyrinomonadaceae bacterium]